MLTTPNVDFLHDLGLNHRSDQHGRPQADLGLLPWPLLFLLGNKPIQIVWGEISTPIPTGVYLELPKGYEAQIRPRSGLAAEYGVSIPNSPATIDSDYRGEIMVVLTTQKGRVRNPYDYIDKNDRPVVIAPGTKIAQLIIQKLPPVKFEVVEELSDTERGEGGFGSSDQ